MFLITSGSIAFSAIVYVIGVLYIYAKAIYRRSLLAHIQPIGFGGVFTSFLTAFCFALNGEAVIKTISTTCRSGVFRLPLSDRWMVIVTGRNLIDDLRFGSRHVLSAEAAVMDLLHSDYTLGPEIRIEPYYLDVLRHKLKKNINELFLPLLDEIVLAFNHSINGRLHNDDWTAIPAMETFTSIVCQSINRIFVDAPLCRDEDFCSINIDFTTQVVHGAVFVGLFPAFLKPLAGYLFNGIRRLRRRALQHIQPIFEARRKCREGQSEGKLNDLVSWLMDACPDQTAESLTLRLLVSNFMAIHTTSMTFVHVLFHLAAEPAYIVPLREELETILGPYCADPHTWTNEMMDKCIKLDSFIKESQRLNNLGAISLPRKTLAPFTFSDGTTIPLGSIVSASPVAHFDKEIYPRPQEFDGFRFSRSRELLQTSGDPGSQSKHASTGHNANYLAYGSGKYRCPGRFIAALEIKAMMALLLLRYDIRPEPLRPQNGCFGLVCTPSMGAKIFLRRRKSYA